MKVNYKDKFNGLLIKYFKKTIIPIDRQIAELSYKYKKKIKLSYHEAEVLYFAVLSSQKTKGYYGLMAKIYDKNK